MGGKRPRRNGSTRARILRHWLTLGKSRMEEFGLERLLTSWSSMTRLLKWARTNSFGPLFRNPRVVLMWSRQEVRLWWVSTVKRKDSHLEIARKLFLLLQSI